MNYKVNQKVWKIRINKPYGGMDSGTLYPEGIRIEESKILGVSDNFVCLNNNSFTTFSVDPGKGIKKQKYNLYLNDTKIRIVTKETYFPNGVFITRYTTTKPTKKQLNSMILSAQKEIDKHYGFLFNGISGDLRKIVDDYDLSQNIQ